ncbi:CPBP family glutamic-type intramembrane protease [Pandoraea anhela]|uniref:Abortive infection protein n=1 Tax=Pandoraea anhela TaxID=2508295 RepID=A0A5E4WL94_9BURK|nr:CPBP family glutamic-type intramembrane protease [Pandoraea anhela]VVE24400.1 abortive infection protein [Pandoraea anhela]
MYRIFRSLLVAALGLLPLTHAHAAPSKGNPLLTQDVLTQQVDAASHAKYREIVATFDAAIRERPADTALALARCQFMQNYSWSEDVRWAAQAQTDLSICQETLKEKFGAVPEVALYTLQSTHGKAAIEQGLALLETSARWSPGDRGRLHAALANAYEATQDKRNAGKHAVESARLWPETPVLLLAVRYLASTGDKTQATRLLMDAPAPKVPWLASTRINTAYDVLPGTTARELLQRMQQAGLKIDAYTSARALLQAGDAAGAQRALADTQPGAAEIAQNRALRLSVALAAGDGKAASTALQSSLEHDTGNRWPLSQSYAVLLTIDPLAAMHPAFLGLMLTLIAIGLCIVSLPGLLMFPVHYVGTVRARKGRPTLPIFEGIGLRHAWYGLAVFCLVTWVVPALMIGQTSTSGTGMPADLPLAQPKLAIAQFITLGLVSLALAHTLWKFGWRQWPGDGQWKVRWFIWPAILLTITALSAWTMTRHGLPDTPDKPVWNEIIVRSAEQAGGAGLAFLLIAIAVPIVEEFVFRGCLLGGLTRHMSFAAANLWQAVIFASVHFDAKHFLFFMLFGLTTGWLAKKTHGLAVPIVIHAINNAIFVGMVLAR